MKSIKQVLEDKKIRVLACVNSGDSVQRAADLMNEMDIGAILVIEDGALNGIITERDCVQKVMAHKLDAESTTVKEAMTSRVRYATPEQTVDECLTLMTERFFRHLPILDEHKNVLGIVSIGDMVKEKISDQEFIIGQLEKYISS